MGDIIVEKNLENTPVLEVKNICKSFGGVKALKGANFELKAGEVHALVGENGAGKSTMMNIIGGLFKQDCGEIFLMGNRVEFNSPRDSQDKGISFIHQELSLFPNLDVISNIFIEKIASDKYTGFVDYDLYCNKTKEILQEMELNINPHTKIKNLSLGERQMVEIARMYVRDTKILVLDEPTSSLTEKEVSLLFKLIRRMKELNVAVIYISHRMDEIFEIADRVTILRDGETVGVFNIKDIDKKTLIKHMIGRNITEQYPPKKHVIGDDNVFEVENLTNSKVTNISFSIKKGEVVGFAGLLGSGRTELARAIFGLDGISYGKIKVDGKEVRVDSPNSAIKNGIGFVTDNRQDEGLILDKSIKENMVLASLPNYVNNLFFMDEPKQYKDAEKFIKQLAIKTTSCRQSVNSLSGGNQQKVVISKWLLTTPKVLILDEPTRGVDVGAKYEIYKLVDELASQGVGVMYISSEIPEILGVCDRVVVMRKGRIVGELDTKETSQEDIMNLAQGGDF